ncbi:molybdopterin adenylyltransferase [Neorhodopirellula lusitana]|uniref:Molybdenum cofactor biosynthesis protein B n=1 Tax=Neorhodopirellula lusitana TaxID=445327 RepID=A0ABY1QQW3_9BACT|nr:MogA/MoaB family molybdenum cofactor biosynthesis protein [Neorhodopirellula lusitana]SMP77967.1 molybdopterin adenylyltransferase [Neorhodopirellula lusitana]
MSQSGSNIQPPRDGHVHDSQCDCGHCGCPEVDGQVSLQVAVITLSDTRTLDDDRSGNRIAELLTAGQHEVAVREIMTDDAEPLRERMLQLAETPNLDAIITTGGTGIAPRDLAIDVIETLLDVELPGFGEHFRAISIAEIGPKAMLSRATAGRMGRVAVFALPGSTGAVTTGMTQCVLPIIRHATALCQS